MAANREAWKLGLCALTRQTNKFFTDEGSRKNFVRLPLFFAGRVGSCGGVRWLSVTAVELARD